MQISRFAAVAAIIVGIAAGGFAFADHQTSLASGNSIRLAADDVVLASIVPPVGIVLGGYDGYQAATHAQ
jgi:hypothetical protein